jgi:excisionase family DNA binding protein
MSRSDLEFIARQVVAMLREDMKPASVEGFVRAAKAAKLLDLSERTMRDMLARGVIPSYKFEGARCVSLVDLEAYAAARREDRAA